MNPSKRKIRKAAGWSIGDPKGLLGLTKEEVLLIEIKLAFAMALQRERQRRRWTQEHLARFLGTSQSRLARMEAGDRSVSIDLMVGALVHMGVTRNELARALRTSAA